MAEFNIKTCATAAYKTPDCSENYCKPDKMIRQFHVNRSINTHHSSWSGCASETFITIQSFNSIDRSVKWSSQVFWDCPENEQGNYMTEENNSTSGGDDLQWNVTKDKLIREINSTYEAIQRFRDHKTKSTEELEALTMDELYRELQDQTSLLDKLVSDWDIQK